MERKKIDDTISYILLGLLIAFFVLGLAAAGYLAFKYGRDVHPGGFITNRGKILTLTPTTVQYDPDHAWSTKETRITEGTTILDIGKEVISVSDLSEGDLIFVHGIDTEEYIEAVTITVLPPDPENDSSVIRKKESSD